MENNQNLKSITRSNGKPYTLKDNKDRFFYPREWNVFSDKLKPKQLHSCKILLFTGARIMEVQHCEVRDVDLQNKRLVLRKTKIKAKKKEKRGRIRTIPISTQFARYLKGYFDRNKLIDTDKIGVLSTPALNIAMKKAAKEIGLDNPGDFSPHNLRKTLETWLMSLGCQDSILLAHFGHDLKTLSSAYVSPDVFSNQEKMMIRDIIGDLYFR